MIANLEGVLELGGVDGEALQLPQHVGEPESDEPNIAVLDDLQDVVGGLGSHGARAVGHLILRSCGRRLRGRYSGEGP
jgi:hypothetical protein